jgi:hypothetical protein
MVIVKLIGGLGNQLFQYAAARRLSCMLQTTLKLDATYFKAHKLRTYSLHPFNIQEVFASPGELGQVEGRSRKGLDRIIFRLGQKLKLRYQWTVIRESYTGLLDPRVINASGDVYLSGYWQSEEYFADIQDVIRREFTIEYEQDPQSKEIAQMIDNTQAVSIHIRRGDYISDPRTHQVHGICDLEYYQECARQIAEKVAQPHFFAFSDDPRWVTENLRLEYPITFVTHNDVSKGYEDLRLMSMCQHHIIANSSFSWWGAWLNSNPNKTVFAPRKWFNDSRYDTNDVIPHTWIKV